MQTGIFEENRIVLPNPNNTDVITKKAIIIKPNKIDYVNHLHFALPSHPQVLMLMDKLEHSQLLHQPIHSEPIHVLAYMRLHVLNSYDD